MGEGRTKAVWAGIACKEAGDSEYWPEAERGKASKAPVDAAKSDGTIPPTVRQHRRAIGNGDINGGGKRQDIDNYKYIADRSECEYTSKTPLAVKVIFRLIEHH